LSGHLVAATSRSVIVHAFSKSPDRIASTQSRAVASLSSAAGAVLARSGLIVRKRSA
jgi:hypothetical protein